MKCEHCGNTIGDEFGNCCHDDAQRIHLFCDQQPRRILDLTAELIELAHGLGHALDLLDDTDRASLRAAKRYVEEVRGHLTLRINQEAGDENAR